MLGRLDFEVRSVSGKVTGLFENARWNAAFRNGTAREHLCKRLINMRIIAFALQTSVIEQHQSKRSRRTDRPPTDAPINDRRLSIDINLSTLNSEEYDAMLVWLGRQTKDIVAGPPVQGWEFFTLLSPNPEFHYPEFHYPEFHYPGRSDGVGTAVVTSQMG